MSHESFEKRTNLVHTPSGHSSIPSGVFQKRPNCEQHATRCQSETMLRWLTYYYFYLKKRSEEAPNALTYYYFYLKKRSEEAPNAFHKKDNSSMQIFQ